MGKRNVAPTKEDQHHHVYSFSIDLKTPEAPFVFEESIGGGHAERGGAIWLSVNEIEAWGDWRNHLKCSGCSWAIENIEQGIFLKLSSEDLANKILSYSPFLAFIKSLFRKKAIKSV